MSSQKGLQSVVVRQQPRSRHVTRHIGFSTPRQWALTTPNEIDLEHTVMRSLCGELHPLVTGKRHGATFASAGVPKRAHYDCRAELLIQQVRHFDQVFRCTLCFYPPTTLIQIWVRTVLGERHTVFSDLMLGVVSTFSSGMTSKGTPLR